MGGEVRVRNCYYEKKKESITNRVAKVQLREVQGVGIQKKKCLLYTRTIMMLITNISLNFTIRTSWTWRGLKTLHLPFLRESVRCTVCSSPNVTYSKDCRDILGV